MEVTFSYQKEISIADRTALKAFVGSIFKKEKGRSGTIQYVFCDDAFLLNINRQALHHDYYTDIITFDLSEPGTKHLQAEIYISIDRVRENAGLYKQPVSRELLRVIFHGALHLCGYKDKSKADQAIMRQKEDFYLALYSGK